MKAAVAACEIFCPQDAGDEEEEKTDGIALRFGSGGQGALCRPKQRIQQCHDVTERIGSDVADNLGQRESALTA